MERPYTVSPLVSVKIKLHMGGLPVTYSTESAITGYSSGRFGYLVVSTNFNNNFKRL